MPINSVQSTPVASPDPQPGSAPPSPPQQTPVVPPDRIARSEPGGANDYTTAIHNVATAASIFVARGSAIAANAAPTVGDTAFGSATLGGPIAGTAAVLLSPLAAGNADEASAGASWRAASNSVSDRATFTAAHPPATMTTTPARAPAAVQHTEPPAPSLPKTDVLRAPVDPHSGTAHTTAARTEPSSLLEQRQAYPDTELTAAGSQAMADLNQCHPDDKNNLAGGRLRMFSGRSDVAADALRKSMENLPTDSAGKPYQVHHLVEQNQTSTFGTSAIQNSANAVALPRSTHQKISAFIVPKPPTLVSGIRTARQPEERSATMSERCPMQHSVSLG